MGLLGGSLIGLIVWAAVWGLVAMGWIPDKNDFTRLGQALTVIHSLTGQAGLAGTVFIASMTTAMLARDSVMKARRRAGIAAELGPLPDDAPDSLKKARKQYLGQ
jgi:hypothetical protein